MRRNTIETIEDTSGTVIKIIEVQKNDWQRSVHISIKGESVDASQGYRGNFRGESATIKFQSPEELLSFADQLNETVEGIAEAFQNGNTESRHHSFICGGYGRDCGYAGVADNQFYIGKKATYTRPGIKLEDPAAVIFHLAEAIRSYLNG